MEEKSENKNLKWWILLTVIVGTFLGRLDQTIVNLALPKIINDFSISVNAAGWIATAYILANAVFVPIWGKLGDTIGRKKVYILGFAIFILGSVLAGLAWNLSSMILFRVIQAIAGSADYPTAMAILAVTFKQGKERAQALGIWSSSFAAASVFGPLQKKKTKYRVLDWWGSITLGGMLSALVLILDKGADWGWLSVPSLLCYFSAIVLLVFFLKIEKSAPDPIVDLRFFKIPAFVNTLLNNFIIFMGMMGALFLIPIFAQTFLGYNATESGYLFIPMAAALMLAAPIGGILTGRVESRYVIFASTMVAAVGIYLFSFLDPKSSALDIMIPLAIMAFGMGFGMAQRTNIIASVVDPHEIGIASSILALARNIAGAFGIAIFGTILNNRMEHNILSINSLSTLNSSNPANIHAYTSLVELKAQINAYDYVFFFASMLVFAGAFAVLFLKVKSERTDVKVHVE